MLTFVLRGIALPFLLIWSLVRTIIKLAAVPVVFILGLFIKSWYIIIAGLLAGIFLTPIATVVICILALIYAISSASEMTSDFIHYRFKIRWDYAQKLRYDYEVYTAERDRQKREKKAIREYDKCADEFVGFDALADIFTK